jgi:hypothetical protein
MNRFTNNLNGCKINLQAIVQIIITKRQKTGRWLEEMEDKMV